TFRNESEVWDRLYGSRLKSKIPPPKCRVGDRVRLNKKHRPFKKGYLPGWTEEVFFPNNANNSFKVRLPERLSLPGAGWHASLLSLTVPDQGQSNAVIATDPHTKVVKISLTFLTRKWVTGSYKQVEIKKKDYGVELEEIMSAKQSVTTGSEFWKRVMQAVHNKIMQALINQQSAAMSHHSDQFPVVSVKKNWMPMMSWKGDALVLHAVGKEDLMNANKSKVTSAFMMDLEIAKSQTPPDHSSYPSVRADLNWNGEHYAGMLPKDLTDDDDIDQMFEVKGKRLLLSRMVEWQFNNLDASFEKMVGTSKRTVMVYSDLVESTVVGSGKYPLLREVQLLRTGEGESTAEPLHHQWIKSNTYHYRAYLETLLNYNREEGATKLAPQGWINQLNVAAEIGATAANSDVPVAANWSGNADLRTLTSKLLSENWHTFIVRPHLPPLKTGKLLVPNVQLDFELFLNPKTIYLMGSPNKGTLTTKKIPAIHNNDIKVTLLMKKVTLNASVYVRLQKERQLGKQIARYPVVRSEIRTFSFDGRTTQWEQDNVFVGRFPDRVMVGLLHSDAFNGDLERYPFAFQKFGVTQVRQTLNGEEYPYRTLQLTGDQAYEDLLGYDRFLQAMGAYNEDKIPMLLPGDWGQGKNCTLFMFNNVPSGKADDPQYRNPRQSGNTRLVIDFAAAVGHNITVLVWSEYENMYEINHLGGIKYNING
ncbi:unnamed protein product, partial [Porites lobata]